MRLHKSIVKDKRKENIKIEITRHTVFCIIILLAMQISALIEAYASTSLLEFFIRYI